MHKGLVQPKFARSLYSALPVPHCRKLLVEEGIIHPHTFNVAALPDAQLQQRFVS